MTGALRTDPGAGEAAMAEALAGLCPDHRALVERVWIDSPEWRAVADLCRGLCGACAPPLNDGAR